MRLEVFSSRDKNGEKDRHLEDSLLHKDVILHQEVQEYAQSIIDKFKALKKKTEEDQIFFLVDVLSDESILRLAKADWSTRGVEDEEVKSVVGRLREALLEQLKIKKVDFQDKIQLAMKDLVENSTLKPIIRPNVIREVVDIDNNKVVGIYKDQWNFFEKHKDAFVRAHQILQAMGPHPNIATIKAYNPEKHEIVYESLNITPLDKYLDNLKFNKENLVLSLKTLKDCVVGASELAYNPIKSLVLQDICPHNLGVVDAEGQQENRGVLFDLEFLLEAGTEIPGRIVHEIEYYPPEALKFKAGTDEVVVATPDNLEPTKIEPSEMVYQLGKSLEKIVGTYSFLCERDINSSHKMSNVVKSLTELYKDMIKSTDIDKAQNFEEYLSNSRITLREVVDRLNEIIEKFEKSNV